jgi:phage baseplate assembly protein W
MKFWMSGEIMADVDDVHREARNEIEDELNARFASRDYGRALQKLAFIAIIRPNIRITVVYNPVPQ